MEIWKEIIGFNNMYFVSNKGRVKSNKRTTKFGCSFKTHPDRIMNPWKDKKGYLYIDISYNNNKTRYLLHRLVAMHFICNTENKQQINHIDGNKSNNETTNLEWCTPMENIRHAIDTGLSNLSSMNNPNKKLTLEDINTIRKSSETDMKLSIMFNVSQPTINRVRTYKTYKNV